MMPLKMITKPAVPACQCRSVQLPCTTPALPGMLEAPPRPMCRAHLAVLMAVSDSVALRVVPALRAHDIVDLLLEQLVQNPEPDTDAQREQTLLRRPPRAAPAPPELAQATGPRRHPQPSRPSQQIRCSRRFLQSRVDFEHPARSQHERTRQEDRHLQSSTSYGTTSFRCGRCRTRGSSASDRIFTRWASRSGCTCPACHSVGRARPVCALGSCFAFFSLVDPAALPDLPDPEAPLEDWA
jgi:hypothetical protein